MTGFRLYVFGRQYHKNDTMSFLSAVSEVYDAYLTTGDTIFGNLCVVFNIPAYYFVVFSGQMTVPCSPLEVFSCSRGKSFPHSQV